MVLVGQMTGIYLGKVESRPGVRGIFFELKGVQKEVVSEIGEWL